MIDHQYPVAIAIKGDPNICTLRYNRCLQSLDMSRAAVIIDVQAIGLSSNHRNIRSQLAEYTRRHLVSCTMSTIEHHLQPSKIGAGRHTALAELDITPCSIIDARRLANLCRLNHRHRLIQQLLNHQFHFIWQLGALTGKELDAIIVMRIVRGTDDNAGLRLKSTGQIGHCRSWHRPQKLHIGAGSSQPSLKSRLEHIAGNARVLANQNAALAVLAESHARRPAELEHELGSDWILPDMTTNTVGSEILSAH